MPIRELAKRLFLGESRDPLDPHVFHQISLIAFLAWVGLGADGLSSSAYGPEEAFVALGRHPHLAVFLAIATAGTVFLISASYSQLIELFPSGGGGYLVATRLLGEGAGLVSGVALVIDYILTIAISVAAGVAALASLRAAGVPPGRQLVYSLAIVGLLVVLNLRGMKESIQVLLPIFVVFLVSHVLVLLYGLGSHLGGLPQLVRDTATETQATFTELGTWGAIFLLLKAFSLGGGTYTGIEAVSNGMQILREPRVKTGKRTMTYMAISLSFMAAALILCYLLAGVRKVEGTTLNASLYKILATEVFGAGTASSAVVLICLLSEGALLFVAAQASFLAGPRVLANMAIDSWVPHRFSLLSERLVAQNGVLIMGLSAVAMLLYTGASVHVLVVMYSINVFLTFTLSQLGMCVHWWQVRRQDTSWGRRFLLNGVGLMVTATILAVTVVLKFRQGAWVTVITTTAAVAFCVLIRRHYNSVKLLMKRADDVLLTLPKPKPSEQTGTQSKALEPVGRSTPTAVFLVSGFNGLGIHSLLQVQKYFPKHFKNAVFLSVGVVDSAKFKGADEVENLKRETERDLNRYVEFARSLGMHAEHHLGLGTDLLDEIVELCRGVKEKYDRPVFFTSKLIFPDENFATRLLHNQTPFAVQRRLQLEGLQTVILPIQVSV